MFLFFEVKYLCSKETYLKLENIQFPGCNFAVLYSERSFQEITCCILFYVSNHVVQENKFTIGYINLGIFGVRFQHVHQWPRYYFRTFSNCPQSI